MDQGSNFLNGGSFSNRNNVRAPIQFRRERIQQHLKRFFVKNRTSHFHINTTTVIRHVKRNRVNFSNIEINKSLPAPVHSVSKIRFKFRIHFQQLPQIRYLITLRKESSIISIDSNITDNITKKIINASRKSVGPKMEP